jgi:hypothetical protein
VTGLNKVAQPSASEVCGLSQETEDNPDTQPLVRLCTMEDLEKMLCKAGLTDPIKVE